ncbi:hypothetical protein Dsin_027526 [Dipteronia sinensis]|uniref:beta-galactosidase n=1 Tax=Dipteronia sinensis TaxID=43782 RepID=A0AAD9ZNW9_9ROSI|nr:hypothetical protein Dsin_027526 [Dipteronia sinensis]
MNYYMYFGGTNFGRTSGGPFYITSYDYDAPIDEYGLLSEPKWGHLKDLHAAIKLCEPALVAADSPQYIRLGPNQEAHVYRVNGLSEGLNSSQYGSQSSCSAFLANIDEHKAASVSFFGQSYILTAMVSEYTTRLQEHCGSTLQRLGHKHPSKLWTLLCHFHQNFLYPNNL